MIPAPAIIPRSMSFIDAIPSSSTRQLSTSAFSVKRSTSAAASMSVPVLIEALSSLGAEVAGGDQLLHLLVDEEPIAVRLPEVLGDVQHGVESEQIGEEERAHRCGLRLGHDLVDLLDVDPRLLLELPQLGDARVEDPVDHEARGLAA